VKIRLGCRQLELLLEALRRYTRFGKPEGKTLIGAWTGLGAMTTYAPCLNVGLMTYATSPNPGYSTWWRLTDKGAKIVQVFLDNGYNYQNVENGFDNWSVEYKNTIGICPHSFFPDEKSNRATFDFKKGEFV